MKKNIKEFLRKYIVIVIIIGIYVVGEIIFQVTDFFSSDNAVVNAGIYISEENNLENDRDYKKYNYIFQRSHNGINNADYMEYYDVKSEQEIKNIISSYNTFLDEHPFYASRLKETTIRFYYDGWTENEADYKDTLILEIVTQKDEKITQEIDASKIFLYRVEDPSNK
ncbi:MAG: hypothetical protein MJ093_02280 [Saccharofermentans sp.]|nr:hypothetical protein [Saccharofermentans sp.]